MAQDIAEGCFLETGGCGLRLTFTGSLGYGRGEQPVIARAVSLDILGLGVGGGWAFPARPACFLSSETEYERLSEGPTVLPPSDISFRSGPLAPQPRACVFMENFIHTYIFSSETGSHYVSIHGFDLIHFPFPSLQHTPPPLQLSLPTSYLFLLKKKKKNPEST